MVPWILFTLAFIILVITLYNV
eukprot:SAG31_NODE_13709_length_852_cov_0.954847_3_plen_21_part_01